MTRPKGVLALCCDRRSVHLRGHGRLVGLLLAPLALSACNAAPATAPVHESPSIAAAAASTGAAPAPPCPPVHELSYLVGEPLHATGARSHSRAGTVNQLCTYAPSAEVNMAGDPGRQASEAPFMFRIPAVPRAASVRAAHAHFSRLIHAAGPGDRFWDATLAGAPALGPGAFVLGIPRHDAQPRTCEVVEQNGNGQPIGVTVRAVGWRPHALKLLCRQALAAAHMLP